MLTFKPFQEFKFSALPFLVFLMLFLGANTSSFGQTAEKEAIEIEKETVIKKEPIKEEVVIAPKHKYFTDHNPTKAMWMSAALPGLGQYYNRKFWKIPVVYTGFATLAYFSIINKQGYVKYRDAYSKMVALDGEPSEDPSLKGLTEAQLLLYRESYQRDLELNYILFGAFYILQIIDATVDAHFYQYNISDNLSLRADPIIYQNNNRIYATPGLQLRWTIGKP